MPEDFYLLKFRNYASVDQIEKKLNIDLSRPIVIFTQHSVTTEYLKAKNQLFQSIKALIKITKKGAQVIITYPNNDVGGETIKEYLNKFFKNKDQNIKLIKSLGRFYYHGILALAKKNESRIVCVGNSSSGIKETPFFGCPTVNIGSRQKGRLRAKNVIDTKYNSKEIYQAILKCIDDKKFIRKCKSVKNPYKGGNAGVLIADYLSKIKLDLEKILRKKMTIK